MLLGSLDLLDRTYERLEDLRLTQLEDYIKHGKKLAQEARTALQEFDRELGRFEEPSASRHGKRRVCAVSRRLKIATRRVHWAFSSTRKDAEGFRTRMTQQIALISNVYSQILALMQADGGCVALILYGLARRY